MSYFKKRINIEGIAISYLEKPGNGRIVLALHGNSCSSDTWVQFIEDAAETDYHIIAPDLPGHGDSGKATDPQNDYTIGGLANIIQNFISELDIVSYTCIGHSLGGNIAYNLLDNDSRLINALTLGSPPFSLPLEESIPRAYKPNPSFPNLLKGELTESEATDTAAVFDPVHRPFIVEAIRKTDPNFRIQLGNSVGTLNGIRDEVQSVNKNKDRVKLVVNKSDGLVNDTYYQQFPPECCINIDKLTHSPHHVNGWLLQLVEELYSYR